MPFALLLACLPALGERRGGKSSTSSPARVCGLSFVTATPTATATATTATDCDRLLHRLPLPLPALLGVGPAPGYVRSLRIQYSRFTTILVRLKFGGSHYLQGCVLLIQSCLGMAWGAHGMGRSRAELHVGQVQGRSVAGAPSSLECGMLYPMPGLLARWPALLRRLLARRPLAARCVSRSWSVANPAN